MKKTLTSLLLVFGFLLLKAQPFEPQRFRLEGYNDAKSVDFACSVDGWKKQAMQAQNGGWEIEVRLPPGRHLYHFLPAATPPVNDPANPLTGYHKGEARSLRIVPFRHIAQLRDVIDSALLRLHMPGAMVALVTRDSVLLADGFGLADKAHNKAATATTLFRQGSITKSFAALGILKLVEAGKLSLDSPLRELAPELPIRNRWESSHPLTVRMLLEHTAGFDDMHFRAMYNMSANASMPMMEVLAHTRNSLICRWPPGTRFSYSNPGYSVAGYLIEKLSGMPFEQYLTMNVLRPMGMQYADFRSVEVGETPIAAGYQYKAGDYDAVPFRPIYDRPAGALNASALDMARFVQCLLNGGKVNGTQVLPAGTPASMERAQASLAAQCGMPRNYGLANYSSRLHGFVFQGHNGGIGGFSSAYAYHPGLGVGFAVSNNGEGDVNELARIVAAYLIPADTAATIPESSFSFDAAQLRQYEGYYQYLSPRNQLLNFAEFLTQGKRLRLRNDTLFITAFNEAWQPLLPMGEGAFRRPGDDTVTVMICKDESGNPVLLTGGDYFERRSFAGITALRAGIALSLLLWISLLLAGIVWSLMRWPGKALSNGEYGRRMVAAGAALCLALAIGSAFSFQNFIEPGQFNLKTLFIFLGTLLFGALSLWSLFVALRDFSRSRSRWMAGYLLIAGLGMVCLCVWLGINGLIGLRLWAY